MEKQNFYDLNFDQLKAFLIEKGEVEPKKAKMRSQQLFNAVYKKNIKSFDELTTFGSELRSRIKDLISLEKLLDIDDTNLYNFYNDLKTDFEIENNSVTSLFKNFIVPSFDFCVSTILGFSKLIKSLILFLSSAPNVVRSSKFFKFFL